MQYSVLQEQLKRFIDEVVIYLVDFIKNIWYNHNIKEDEIMKLKHEIRPVFMIMFA